MRRSLWVAGSLILLAACAQRLTRAMVAPDALATVDRKAPFLKVHMRDGSAYVLSSWTEAERRVSGMGKRYALDRTLQPDSAHSFALDSVAMFETNVARSSPGVAALAIVTGLSVTLTLACAVDPKACFGSCPTFYITDGRADVLQAEGFSASLAPSLEARDVDALFRARPRGREVRMDMVNEAYETHVVRYANLLAVPRPANGRVFHDGNGVFWSSGAPVAPQRCNGSEGDCLATVAAFDERERTSASDSANLAERETVELTFAPVAGTPGIVLATRQSILPTYLLYQTLAYLGTSATQFLSALQRADSATLARTRSVVDVLGGIEVQVPDGAGTWRTVTTIRETGPLASDVRVIPLPANADAIVRVRLRMAKGAWRVDWAAVVALQQRVTPITLEPHDVRFSGKPAADARAKLVDPEQSLVTYPGDRYTLTYRLPADAEGYEIFLDTRGYYLEWMRDEWIAETNAGRAAAMFLDPVGSLKRLAPAYKQVESQLDSAFWRSKYVAR